MRVLVPVDEDRGLDSPISAHFGDAPYFAVLELSEGSHKVSAVRNPAREGPGPASGISSA